LQDSVLAKNKLHPYYEQALQRQHTIWWTAPFYQGDEQWL